MQDYLYTDAMDEFTQLSYSPQLSTLLLSHLEKTNQPLFQGMQSYQQKPHYSPHGNSPFVNYTSPFINASPMTGTELGFGAELDSFWNQLNDGFPSLFGQSPTIEPKQVHTQLNAPTDYSSISADPSLDNSEFDQMIMNMQDRTTDQTIYKHSQPTLLSPPTSSQLSYISPDASDLAFMQFMQPQTPQMYNQAYSPQQHSVPFKYAQQQNPYNLNKLSNLLRNPPTQNHRNAQEPLQCTHQNCTKRFTMPRTLALHMLSHSDERVHVCEECAQRFKRLPDLQRHVRSMHTVGEGCFVCPEGCGKSFPRSDALKRHLAVKGKSSKFGCELLARN